MLKVFFFFRNYNNPVTADGANKRDRMDPIICQWGSLTAKCMIYIANGWNDGFFTPTRQTDALYMTFN